jgi:hypothetical protein
MHLTITEDQFIDTYRPQINPIDSNASWNNCMLETFGPELALIQTMCATDIGRVWTILECDGQQVVANGFHLVNRQGYLITEIAAKEGDTIEVIDPDDVYEYDDDGADCG